jgi:hypothetical protein
VVALEVPATFGELQRAMLGFFGFAGCFALLIYIWYNHYLYFRRFGLEDAATIALNGVLLFVITFYIYPLKFLANFLVGVFLGFPDGRRVGDVITPGEGVHLMVIYAIGYATIWIVFILLYARAYAKRRELGLTPLEAYDTRWYAYSFLIHIFMAAFSAGLVLTLGPRVMAWAGMSYALIGVGYGVWNPLYMRGRRRLHGAGDPRPD